MVDYDSRIETALGGINPTKYEQIRVQDLRLPRILFINTIRITIDATNRFCLALKQHICEHLLYVSELD